MSGSIQIYAWMVSEFEQMTLGKINARLGHKRKGMLKNFQCGSIMAETVKEAVDLRHQIETCYVVLGFLALDDAGQGRAFKFLIEKGMSWKQAGEVADKLALQIDQCADRMLAEQKRAA